MDLQVAVRSGTMRRGLSGTNRVAYAAGLEIGSFRFQFLRPPACSRSCQPKKAGIPVVTRRARNLLHSAFRIPLFSPWISPFILQSLTAPLSRFRSNFDLSSLDLSFFNRLLAFCSNL